MPSVFTTTAYRLTQHVLPPASWTANVRGMTVLIIQEITMDRAVGQIPSPSVKSDQIVRSTSHQEEKDPSEDHITSRLSGLSSLLFKPVNPPWTRIY